MKTKWKPQNHHVLIIIVLLCAAILMSFVTSLDAIQGTGNNVLITNGEITPVNWLEKYWPFLALVVSEALAFIKPPYNGIIITLLKLGNTIFCKK